MFSLFKLPSPRNLFLTVIITALCGSAALAISIFVRGEFDTTQKKLLITTLVIAGYSLTALCSSALYEKKRYTIVAVAGMLIAAIGLFTAIQAIWQIGPFYHTRDFWKVVVTNAILSFSAAHVSLLLLVQPKSRFMMALLFVTIGFIIVVTGMLTDIVMDRIGRHGDDSFYRILGVFAVLDVLGTLLIPIARRIKSLK